MAHRAETISMIGEWLMAVKRRTLRYNAAPGGIEMLFRRVVWTFWVVSLVGCSLSEKADEGAPFELLFPEDGVPSGWGVTSGADLAKPPPEGARWNVRDGVLYGSDPRGTWLISEREYGDFELEFEFQLGARGNSGCALRTELRGDPAFDALELQMADLRYNPRAKPSELTGGFYRAIAPSQQVYRPKEWNHYRVRLVGSRAHVTLNGVVILDVDLDTYDEPVKRHNGTDAPPIRERPRRGRIGFQELSRDGDQVKIRGAKIREISS